MLFNSFPFILVFLPATLLMFYLAASVGATAGKVFLGGASLAFYTYWFPPFTVILLTSIIFNYMSGSLILRLRGKSLQRLAQAGAVATNLVVLFYYKYAYVVASSMVAAGLVTEPWMDKVLLPLGISFFTFTQIGFLLDCKSGAVKDNRFINYLLFVSFFPHLIAGPILHHRKIMPQFEQRDTYRLHPENLARGFALFAIGLSKKVLIADPFSAYVAPAFADPGHLTVIAAWAAAVGWALQLYFDFSGYSDMAIGIARMFNVQFPLNFDSPFKSLSIVDFWQRWHITLTRFFMMYIYNPLAVRISRRRAAKGLSISREGIANPRAFAVMIALPVVYTMVLAGVWHGAGSQFLIFGVLHAGYMTINHAWRIFGRTSFNPDQIRGRVRTAWRGFCVLLTFVAVVIADVFFGSTSTPAALSMISAMIGLQGINVALPVPFWLPGALGTQGAWLQAHGWIQALYSNQNGGDAFRQAAWLAALLTVVWCTPSSQQIVGLAEGRAALPLLRIPSLRLTRSWGVAVGLVALSAALGIGAKSEFLYFQF